MTPFPDDVRALVQAQLGAELFSAALYRRLASEAYGLGLTSTAKWLGRKAKGEYKHFARVADYLDERGAVAEIPKLEAPSKSGSISAIADAALAREEANTAAFMAIQATASKAGDLLTRQWADWFLAEQLAEEDEGRRFVRFVKQSGDLLALDQQIRDEFLS